MKPKLEPVMEGFGCCIRWVLPTLRVDLLLPHLVSDTSEGFAAQKSLYCVRWVMGNLRVNLSLRQIKHG